MAMFVIKLDRHEEALDVVRRYNWQGGNLWLVFHNEVAELWSAKPPHDHKPYAKVEKYDGKHWTAVR
jgi:hypothetical protein